MTIAEQIYRRLDEAGLTEPVHYIAASERWRTALESIEVEIEAEMEHLLFLASQVNVRRDPVQMLPGESFLNALRRLNK